MIEKEYAGKLSALAKKYFERKAKRSSSLSVGDTPTVTPGSLESASMTTWTVQLTTLESRAAEHDRYAGQLIANLADPLKHLQTRTEELRKLHAEFATKLEKERDTSYGDLRKVKGKYDTACQELENKRKKSDGAFDHGKSKAATAYQQQLGEANNVKVGIWRLAGLLSLTWSRTRISLTSTSRISKKSDTTMNMFRSC